MLHGITAGFKKKFPPKCHSLPFVDKKPITECPKFSLIIKQYKKCFKFAIPVYLFIYLFSYLFSFLLI